MRMRYQRYDDAAPGWFWLVFVAIVVGNLVFFAVIIWALVRVVNWLVTQ